MTIKYPVDPTQEEQTVTIPASEYRMLIETQQKYHAMIEARRKGGRKASKKLKGDSEHMSKLASKRWKKDREKAAYPDIGVTAKQASKNIQRAMKDFGIKIK